MIIVDTRPSAYQVQKYVLWTALFNKTCTAVTISMTVNPFSSAPKPAYVFVDNVI